MNKRYLSCYIKPKGKKPSANPEKKKKRLFIGKWGGGVIERAGGRVWAWAVTISKYGQFACWW